PGSTGSQRVAGASSGSSAIFRGPVRRSRYGAMAFGQLAAAIARSAELISTCASFSASANVATDTDGPAAGAVPNVGGAPAGAPAGVPCGLATGFSLTAARRSHAQQPNRGTNQELS